MAQNLPLFETKPTKRSLVYKSFVLSISVAIFLTWVYRVNNLPPSERLIEQLAWIGMFMAEFWFSLYWFIGQVSRWSPVTRFTFKNRLSERYEKELPRLDIFVCTADPEKEPPILVMNTVLSVMAYDYPPEKLSVYLSDDGGSQLTFYSMLEATKFSKQWLPFCKKFNVQPRSPDAYFRTASVPQCDLTFAKEWLLVKKLYEEMKNRIEDVTNVCQVPQEIRNEHKGFNEWDFITTPRDHQPIVEILVGGRGRKDTDQEGQPLPTIVYLAREKRPQYAHNFKAGSVNALIRVSAMISNAPIILNVDCDMYSNNSSAARDAMCFFMDEEQGNEIAFVQYPQAFENLTKNDIYASAYRVSGELEFHGMDANGGPPYIGTGCFHRREALCGRKYSNDFKVDWKALTNGGEETEKEAKELEQSCKVLASCTYEKNTEWGKEMGLVYGFPVEDIISGLKIQCRGWKSVYCNPKRQAFLGLGPTTLLDCLVQQKRWTEGHMQIFLSKYCSLLYGRKKISLKLQLCYARYNLWAAHCLPTIYYVCVPPLCLLRGISLYPQASCVWVYPFVYAVIASSGNGLVEFMQCGGTLRAWWNSERMWMFKRTTSFLFGFIDAISKILGITKYSTFVITGKSSDNNVAQRYDHEVMEFGVLSPMFTMLATFALINVFGLTKGMWIMITDQKAGLDRFSLQITGSVLLLMLNIPIYEGMFVRKDYGRMPSSITYRATLVAAMASLAVTCIKM